MTTAPNMPDASATRNPVFVSEVIGDGPDAHREVRVGDWTLTVPGADGTEPEIPDETLASRLGMEVRRLRELSERHEKARNIAGDIQGAVDNPAVVAALTRYGDAMEKTAIQAATVAAAASGDVAAAAAIRDNMQVTGVISAGLELRRAVVSAILGAIAKNRDLMGATDPKKADAGTIRADFASSIDENAVHGSDSTTSAAREIGYFFSAIELAPRTR